MKIAIKRRVIDKLNSIDSRIKYSLRRKYRGGHRIHSPYVYKLVRSIFMKKLNNVQLSDAELTVALCQSGLKYGYSYRVGQFLKYNDFKKYSINPKVYSGEDMIVITYLADIDILNDIRDKMKSSHSRSSIVILNIYRNKESRSWWRSQNELFLDIYRLGIIIYDDNLNKEYFKLKI